MAINSCTGPLASPGSPLTATEVVPSPAGGVEDGGMGYGSTDDEVRSAGSDTEDGAAGCGSTEGGVEGGAAGCVSTEDKGELRSTGDGVEAGMVA